MSCWFQTKKGYFEDLTKKESPYASRSSFDRTFQSNSRRTSNPSTQLVKNRKKNWTVCLSCQAYLIVKVEEKVVVVLSSSQERALEVPGDLRGHTASPLCEQPHVELCQQRHQCLVPLHHGLRLGRLHDPVHVHNIYYTNLLFSEFEINYFFI